MRDLYADPEERGRLTERIRTDGHIEDYPIVMKRKDGTLIHCIVTAVVLKDISGVSVGFQGTIRDVTEKKKAEERLLQREATLAAITNSARDAILMLDPEGAISFWNPAAEQMLGYGAAEAVGKNLHALIAPSRFHGAHHAAFPHFVATGQGAAVGKTLELAALRKDGTEIAVELSLSAVQLQGRWHAVGLMRDISERKRIEKEIRLMNEQQAVLVQQLEAQHAQNKILTEMREFLQACSSTAETGPVIERSMRKIFPGSGGALFLMSASRTDLEVISRWGEYPETMEENIITPDECWGLRRGGLYLVENPENAILCSHIKQRISGTYACLPLMAKGEVLGLLHLRSRGSGGEKLAEELKEVSIALTELLSLAISNIRLREMLSNQSIKDPLTGLFNRRYLEETFAREATRARRKKSPIGVIMVDIDHFKKFNDVYGHAAGDMVLTELAKFFTVSLRGADIPCRYGGEEFALVMPEASLENTFIRAEQMVEQVKTIRIPFSGQTLGPITLSMGVAAYPLHGEKLEELLRAADRALYRAKQAGRDRALLAEVSS
jgi:diguanylate cyclase (GGDEF)-like protein/PAS domain S-box-containing protein